MKSKTIKNDLQKINKTAHMHLRVSEKQKDTLLKKAKLAKTSLTSFILKSTDKADINRLLEKEQKFLVGMEIGKELNKIGVNINQLTRHVNAAKNISHDNVDQFILLASEVKKKQNELIKLLNS